MTTNTNYQAMSCDDLNALSAERFGYRYKSRTTYVYDIPTGKESYWFDENDNRLDFKTWHPTHKQSAQCVNYLFPKLSSYGVYANIDWYMRCISFEGAVDTHRYWEDPDDINKVCVAAVLEADDILRGKKS